MSVTELAGLVIPEPPAEPRPAIVKIAEGRIVAVVPADAADRPAVDRRYIVPGFIDCHSHPLETGLALIFPDLAAARTVDEVLARLAAGLTQGLEAGVMLGFNLEPDRLAERRYPTSEELDRATGNVPCLVLRVDGHSGVVNTTGLNLLATVSDSADTGLLRGRTYERAAVAFKRRLNPEIVTEALSLAGRLAASRGITTIGALVGSSEYEERDWAVLLDGLAQMAVRAVPFMQTWQPSLAQRFGQSRVGGCLLIDGSFGSRTAALTEEYADEKGNQGILYQRDETVAGFIRAANQLGLQTAFHAIGDRAVAQVVRCHRQAGTEPGNPLRHRIEHAELLTPKLIDEIATLGLILCVQPGFEAAWGGPQGMYQRRLGQRWQRTNPYRTLLSAGVKLAAGSDSPVTEFEPVTGIKAAINHPNPRERITPAQALALFTTQAAFALFLENRLGRIAPGMAADLTVLTSDPRLPGECQVVATYRHGQPIYPSDR